MKKLISVVVALLAVTFLYAAESPEDQRARAETNCAYEPEDAKASCADAMVEKWNSAEYKSEVTRAEAFVQKVYQKCKALDGVAYDSCSIKEEKKFSTKYEDVMEMMKAEASVQKAVNFGASENKKRDKLLALCQRMHIETGTARIGMTAEMARECGWGAPQSINRTTNATSVHEQWVYDGGYLYFTNGVLTSIQN